MIMGNHDMRIDKKTGGQVTLEMLLDDTEMQFSRYSYMYLWMPKVREWVYVCHQFNYSRTSVKLAQQVWNVVSAPDGYDTRPASVGKGIVQWTPNGRPVDTFSRSNLSSECSEHSWAARRLQRSIDPVPGRIPSTCRPQNSPNIVESFDLGSQPTP